MEAISDFPHHFRHRDLPGAELFHILLLARNSLFTNESTSLHTPFAKQHFWKKSNDL